MIRSTNPHTPPASSASVKTAMPVGAAAVGGTAASQPPQTAVSPQEIEAILVNPCSLILYLVLSFTVNLAPR
jgi:hypothetical protein